MSRRRLFDHLETAQIPALLHITEPCLDERTAAVVDLPLLGPAGCGKTQFAAAVARTLRAWAPELDAEERRDNDHLLAAAVNPSAPWPDPTAPGAPRHYTFRVATGALVAELGFLSRARLLLRAAGFGREVALAAVVGAAVTAALGWLLASASPLVLAAGLCVALAGCAIGWSVARDRLTSAGDLEVVVWDVAGQDIEGAGAADHRALLTRLVRARRRSTGSLGYALAPVLVCNPLTISTKAGASMHARMLALLPLYAELGKPHLRALVAINRYAAVRAACAPDSDRAADVVVIATDTRDDDATAASITVSRELLRRYCVDAENHRRRGVRTTYLRYDAAHAVTDVVDTEVGATVNYGYENSTNCFDDHERAVLLDWLVAVAFPGGAPPRGATELPVAAASDRDHQPDWQPDPVAEAQPTSGAR